MERGKYSSGIYQILNTINNRCYIGSAVNLKKRFIHHQCMLNNKRHPNKYLQKAWNKYGCDSFSFTILFYCVKEDLIQREQEAIDFYKDTKEGIYNLKPTAGSNLGYKHTPATLAKMSKSQKGHSVTAEQRQIFIDRITGSIPWNKGQKGVMPEPWNKGTKGVMIAWNKGLKSSPETCLKLSESHKGKKPTAEQSLKHSLSLKKLIQERGQHWNVGKHHTEEAKEAISKFQKGRKRSQETIDRWRESRGSFKHTQETKDKISATKKLRNQVA